MPPSSASSGACSKSSPASGSSSFSGSIGGVVDGGGVGGTGSRRHPRAALRLVRRTAGGGPATGTATAATGTGPATGAAGTATGAGAATAVTRAFTAARARPVVLGVGGVGQALGQRRGPAAGLSLLLGDLALHLLELGRRHALGIGLGDAAGAPPHAFACGIDVGAEAGA